MQRLAGLLVLLALLLLLLLLVLRQRWLLHALRACHCGGGGLLEGVVARRWMWPLACLLPMCMRVRARLEALEPAACLLERGAGAAEPAARASALALLLLAAGAGRRGAEVHNVERLQRLAVQVVLLGLLARRALPVASGPLQRGVPLLLGRACGARDGRAAPLSAPPAAPVDHTAQLQAPSQQAPVRQARRRRPLARRP